MIQIDLQLLLPRTSTPAHFDMFVINLPRFKQVLGNLSHVFFEHFKIVDPGTAITVEVRTPVLWTGLDVPDVSVSSPFLHHRS